MASEITITVASAAAPTLVEKMALRALYAARVVANSSVVLYKVLSGAVRGQNYDFVELGAATVGSIGADGVIVTNSAITHTQRQVALSRWRGVNFSVPYRPAAQSVLDYDKELAISAGKALGEDMDDSLLDNHGSITTNVEGSTSNPVAMSDSLLRAAIADIDDQDVEQENRTLILRPKALRELQGEDKFSLAYATGLGKGVQISGLLTSFYGTKAVVTSRVVSTGGVLKNLLLHKECIGMVLNREITFQKHDKVGDYTIRYLADYLGGEAVLREQVGAVINSAA